MKIDELAETVAFQTPSNRGDLLLKKKGELPMKKTSFQTPSNRGDLLLQISHIRRASL